jgi:hypothetical protein
VFVPRSRERRLDAFVTHAERILHDERSDRPIPQHLNKSAVGIKADKIDDVAVRVCLLASKGLRGSAGHDQVRDEDATELRIVRDELRHHTQSRIGLSVADFMDDDIQRSVFGGNLILETFGALINRSDIDRRRDDGYVTFGVGLGSLNRVGKSICSELPDLSVVGPQRRGERHRLCIGVDPDDLRFLGGILESVRSRRHPRRPPHFDKQYVMH